MRLLKRVLLVVVGVVATLFLLGGGAYGIYYLSQPKPAAPPPPADTRDGRWQQDVTYLATELPRLHADAFHTVSREEFEQAVAALLADIPALADHEIAVRIRELVASVGDAHTAVWASWQEDHYFPYVMNWFSEGAFVNVAAPAYRHLVGSELVNIGRFSVEEAFQRVSRTISHENEPKLKGSSPMLLANAEVLHALGLLPHRDRGSFTFRTVEGDTVNLEMPTFSYDQWRQIEWVRPDSLPLFRQRRDESFWFTYLEEHRAVYFKYNSCNEPWAFWRFSRTLKRFLKEHDVDKMIVDFRRNGGGNSMQFSRLLLGALKQNATINRRGHLFGVIDRSTFSSAMLNAAELQLETQAILVGESTGGKPNGYGEVRNFTLPNAGIQIGYSTKYIESNPELGDALALDPDLAVAYSVQDYLAGHDAVLEAILTYE